MIKSYGILEMIENHYLMLNNNFNDKYLLLIKYRLNNDLIMYTC